MAWDELLSHDPQLKSIHVVYLFLGAFICIFGLLSLVIKERVYMSEAMVAIIVGIIIGPIAAKQFVPQNFGDTLNVVTYEFSRIVVAIQCMACGVDLPGNYLWKERRSVFMLLGPVMVFMWLVAALGIYWIIGIPFLDALIISACLTPTDPVLANSIVKGKFAEANIPLNVRLILSAESGANDGLGTPFLFLAIYLQRSTNKGLAVVEWFGKVFLYQVVLSVILGTVIAYGAKRALKHAEREGWIDKESILSYSIALALFTMGVASMLSIDDILAVFVAGNVLSWDLWFNKKIHESHFQEIIDALLNLAYFVYVGALVPWSEYGTTSQLQIWKLVLVSLWILILRRLPIVFLMQKYIPALKTPMEAIFAGWFGPIGAGAIFYAQTAIVLFEVEPNPLFPVTIFVVMSSVVLHGGTVAFFNMTVSRTQTYQSWAHYNPSLMGSNRLTAVFNSGMATWFPRTTATADNYPRLPEIWNPSPTPEQVILPEQPLAHARQYLAQPISNLQSADVTFEQQAHKDAAAVPAIAEMIAQHPTDPLEVAPEVFAVVVKTPEGESGADEATSTCEDTVSVSKIELNMDEETDLADGPLAHDFGGGGGEGVDQSGNVQLVEESLSGLANTQDDSNGNTKGVKVPVGEGQGDVVVVSVVDEAEESAVADVAFLVSGSKV